MGLYFDLCMKLSFLDLYVIYLLYAMYNDNYFGDVTLTQKLLTKYKDKIEKKEWLQLK